MTIQQIQKLLDEREISGDVYDRNGGVAVEINYGDWKHDHSRCDYIMQQNGYRLTDEIVTREDGSDCYDSIHYYVKIEPAMTLDAVRKTLRNENPLFWRFSWQKDYGNGTKLIEYKSLRNSRCRKHIGFLQIGYDVLTDVVISCGYNKNGEHFEINSLDDLRTLA